MFFQSHNVYQFIWVTSDLLSLTTVVGIFCFRK